MKADLNKQSCMFVVTGLLQMIEQDGLTFHEAMETLEDIKQQVFPALMQISRERK
jgi:hypothetical protein